MQTAPYSGENSLSEPMGPGEKLVSQGHLHLPHPGRSVFSCCPAPFCLKLGDQPQHNSRPMG